VKQQLRGFLAENFLFGNELEVADDDSLQDAGIIDSTGVMELVTWIEETFGVTVGDDELLPENLDTVNRLTRFLQRKLQAAAPASSPELVGDALQVQAA
jgi:acyl carrier protein